MESREEDAIDLTLSPLLENSEKLLHSSQLNSNVKRALDNLLNMTKCSLALNKSNSRGQSFLTKGKLEKQLAGLKLQKNHVTNIGRKNLTQKSRSSSETLIRSNMTEFCEEYLYGNNVEKSSLYTPNPKVELKGRLVKVTKKYWMTSPIRQIGDGNYFKGPKEMMDEILLSTLPDHFSWTLKYFSTYAQIPVGELLDELVKIENLILHLDEDYFGFQKTEFKVKRRKQKRKKSIL